MRPSPLQNRVDPFGTLFATTARGNWLGNRGGRFHCERTRKIPGRPWATKQWICCRLSFKGRSREVWGRGYTELFFTDEATALAAGHRPCFECRREDAQAFAAAWGRARGGPPPRAPEMDRVLHDERLTGRAKRLHATELAELPDGAMVVWNGAAWRMDKEGLARWSFSGYGAPVGRPEGGLIMALTPPSIIAALRAGYVPVDMR